MKIRRVALIAAGVACIAGASFSSSAPLHAQSSSLAAVDSLIASSRFRDASVALDRWERDNRATISPADRATAMLLRARMVQDADSARDMYLALSLGYPSSPEAGVALLRLGQLAFAADDRTRAASYFQRIISDHPRSAVLPEATAWLAQTRADATSATTRAPQATQATPPAPMREATTAAAENGAFALQVGAFRAANTAATVVRQLTNDGFQARAVTIPANGLVRVRVGRYATSRAADETMRRLRTAGFEAIVVNDARTETAIDR